jgi:DME family drug/metabolite transporter
LLSISPARTSSALLVVAGVLWGTGGLAGAVLQSSAGLSPVAVAAYRLLVGGVLAAVVVVATGQAHLLWPARRRLVAAGLLLAEFQAAYQVAVAQISVSLATLVTIGCVPVFVAGVTARRDRRLPAGRTLAAIAASLVGLALLSGGPSDVGFAQTVSGIVMSLLAGAGFAALTLLTVEPAVTSVALLLGGVILVPFGLVSGMALPMTLDVLWLVAFLGVVPTAVAYGAYFLGLRHAHPTAAALATMLEPLTATALAVTLHGETLTAAGVAGAALIAAAMAIASG